ncbi:MAG: hypothetical protein ACRDZ8_15490 [Acidimicrobiales bacterium]
MLASIHPLGERAKGNRWWVTAVAYLASSLLAGALIGSVAGVVGFGVAAVARPAPVVLAWAVAACCLAAALIEIRAVPVSLPSVRRQVNEDWLNRYRGWVYGAGFGFQLGLGVVTIVTTPAVYLMALMGSLAGLEAGWATGADPVAATLAGSAVGAAFGLVRAMPIFGGVRVRAPGQLRAVHRRLEEARRRSSWLTAGGLAAAATAAALYGVRWA